MNTGDRSVGELLDSENWYLIYLNHSNGRVQAKMMHIQTETTVTIEGSDNEVKALQFSDSQIIFPRVE